MRERAPGLVALVCGALVLSSAAAVARAEDPIQSGRAFLAARQLDAASTVRTTVADSFEVLAALADQGAKDTTLVSLYLAPADNLEAAFLRASALASAPYADPVAAALLREAISRQELGLAPGSRDPDPLVAAAALRFAAADGSAVNASIVVDVLRRLRKADGSFGFADNDGDVAVTAEIARALAGPGGATGADLLQGARTWLRSAVANRTALPAADLALLMLALGPTDEATAQALATELTFRQDPSGAFDGDDLRATALAVQAFVLALPDLVLRPPSFVLDTPTTGQPFAYGVVVANMGAISSPAATIDYTVTDGSGATLLTSSASVPALAAGQQVTVTLNLGVQGAPGTRRLTAVVNSAALIAEGTYDNDVLLYDFRVADRSDLEIVAGDIAVSPSPPMAGGEARVTVRVRNVGDAPATNVHVQIFQGEPGAGGVLLGEQYFNTVANGTPRVLAASYVPQSKDPVRIFARVDPEGIVAEQREDNNSAFVDVPAVNPADVIVDLAASIDANNPIRAQGDPFVVRYQVAGTVKRFGNIYPDASRYGFRTIQLVLYLGSGASLGAEVQRTWVTVAPTYSNWNGIYTPIGVASVQLLYSLPADMPAGRYRLTAVVDPDNLSGDINLANNTGIVDIELTNSGVAELYASTLTSDAHIVDQQHPTTVRARISNIGQATAISIPVTLSTPMRNIAATVASILPGEAGDVAFDVSATDLNPGTNTLTLTIDPQNVIAESSKLDNTATITLERTSSAVTLVSATQQLPIPVTGQPAPVEIVIQNTGFGPLSSCTIRFGLYGSGSRNVDTFDGGPIPVGESRTYMLQLTTQGLVGSQRTLASVECAGGSAYKELWISIASADFAVAPRGITLSPEGALAGQPVTPQVVVNNLGSAGADTSVRIYRGYAEQGDLASSGTIHVDAGGSAAFTGPPFTPPVEPPHVITVVLDQENAVTESDETNNTAVRSTLKKPGDVVVAFDEVHEPGMSIGDTRVMPLGGVTGGLSEFARDLTARGYVVKAITPEPELAALTPSALRGTDVLLAFAPTATYADRELSLIRQFVEAGGGFFYLGDWRESSGDPVPAWAAAEDQLTGLFGVTSDHGEVLPGHYPCVAYGFWLTKSEGVLRPHVITTGVDQVATFWTGSFSSLPADAEIIAKSLPTWLVPNAVMTAVFPVGDGRVALHGDSNLLDADYSGPSSCGQVAMYSIGGNRRFGLQMVDWLAKGALGDWKPDLTFAPAQLTLSQSVVNSGDRIQVKALVRNVGGTIASPGATVVRLYDGTPASETVLGEQQVPDLGVDQEYEVVFDWDTTYAVGRHTLTAVVDPDNLVDEFAEDNNTVAVSVEVRRNVDLRVDASDLVVSPGTPPVASVRVHNLGYAPAQSGASVRIAVGAPGASPALATVALPAIPARGAVTVTTPWPGTFPQGAFDLYATVAPPAGITDADPSNDVASIRFEPPSIAVQAPAAGDRWGGAKTIRWTASGTRRPDLTTALSIGPAGGTQTGLPVSSAGSYDLATTTYPDGDYVVRVAASDGLQSSSQEVAVRIENAVLAIRGFEGGAGSATVSSPGGTAHVKVPVGSRVTSASVLVDPVTSPAATVGSAYIASNAGSKIVEYRGVLHVYYRLLSGGATALFTQSSYDRGATWTSPLQISPSGQPVWAFAAAANSNGLHILYGTDWNQPYNAGDFVAYVHSQDGVTWSAPSVLYGSQPISFTLSATESGLAFAGTRWESGGSFYNGLLATAGPDGSAWTQTAILPSLAASRLWAYVGSGRVHVLIDRYNESVSYSEAPLARAGEDAAFVPRVSITAGAGYPTVQGTWFDDEAIGIVVGIYNNVYAQRCPRAWDCTFADSWSPELVHIGGSAQSFFGWGGGDAAYVYWCSDRRVVARGFGSGAWWAAPSSWSSSPSCGGQPSTFFAADASTTGMLASGGTFYNPVTVYTPWPELTPADPQVDVGGDGTAEVAVSGFLGAPVQSADLAAALNAYLAAHQDADDGAADGYVSVPVAVSTRGAGGITLRNLEVRYQPASAFAAFADPPLFSPSASPGVLDAAMLSVLASGSVVVTDGGGLVRRTLDPTASGGRYVAAFDGRDAVGSILPSGPYRFGATGVGTGDVEIDDIPPSVELRASAEGGYGGLAPIYGRATDSDWAGTAKNFSRYVLEYSRDVATWTTIASSTTPADGLLASWDTRRMAAGPATLRLTAYDRAGNSATTSRAVGVSPNAPIPPVIDTPTVAGAPFDSMADRINVAGVAEPGTTVTLWMGGTAVASAPSDGRWAVSNLALPAGVSIVSASAARNGAESARSQEIVVGRYAFTVVLDAPATAPTGTAVAGTVTLTRASVTGGPVTVQLSVRDATGAVANVLVSPSEQTVALPAAGSASFAVQVGGPGVRAGSYTVRAEVVSGSRVPAAAEREVAFTAVQEILATLYSDKAVYAADHLVGLEATVVNAGASATGGLTATITVMAPSGQATVLGPYPIASIPAGTLRRVGALFGNPPLETGLHLADLRVQDEFENIVAAATTSFDVRPGASTSLAGQLLVTPSVYSIGQALQAEWQVTNTGEAASVGVAVLLVRAADGFVFTRSDCEVSIASASTVPGTTALSTLGTDGHDIVALLLGNGRGLAAQTIAANPIPDTMSPLITFQGVVDGELATSIAPVVVITDDSVFTSELTLNGAPFVNGTRVTVDGEYVVSAHAVDVWGNDARADRRFTVDTVPPQIAFSGVADGALSSVPVVPTVNVTELHPSTQITLLDGSPWDGAPISFEGAHVVSVHATDLAGNPAEGEVRFTIDQTPPVIAITGVSEGSLYGSAVLPAVVVTDANPGSPAWTATLNGNPWTGAPVGSDGEWLLAVDGTDAAGNPGQRTQVQFTVDATAPVIRVSGVTEGLLTRDVVTPVVSIDELHPGTNTVTLDGAPFVSGTNVTTEGPHVLTATATDAAGNAAAPVTVHFTRDTTPPVVTIAGVSDGASYYITATPTFSASDTNLGAVTATLDGVAFASGTRVTANGLHTLQVNATDRAGNATAETVSFQVIAVQASVTGTVDHTPRVIVVVNCAGQPASCADTQGHVLFAALAEAGIRYDVALDWPTFVQRVRENRHNVRIVYRSSSSGTNAYAELRELVFESGGLVIVNDASPDSDPKLKDIVGVSFGGSIKAPVGTVTIAAGDLGPARTLTVAGSGVVQSLYASTASAIGTTSRSIVVTTNQYGAGRAVTLTLNPELNDNASMRDLLVRSILFTAGGAIPAPVPGVPQYVQFSTVLTSPSGPLDVQLDAFTADAGLTLLTDGGLPTSSPRTWNFAVSTAAPVPKSLGVLAQERSSYAPPYRLAGELTMPASGVPDVLARVDVTVSAPFPISQLITEAIGSTENIYPFNKTIETARNNALVELHQVTYPAPTTRAECDASITHTLAAGNYLASVSSSQPDATMARIRTSQLLRALQALLLTLP